MTDKLKKLLERCKCGVHITVNLHRDYYMKADEYIEDDIIPMLVASKSNIDVALKHRQKMIEMDTIIDLQFYPNTPICSYQIFHYDIEQAIEEALYILSTEQ